MDVAHRLLLSGSYRGSCCCPLLWISRVVVVLVVLILSVILALRGYTPGAITGSVLMLVAGAVTASGRLVGVQDERSTMTKPAS